MRKAGGRKSRDTLPLIADWKYLFRIKEGLVYSICLWKTTRNFYTNAPSSFQTIIGNKLRKMAAAEPSHSQAGGIMDDRQVSDRQFMLDDRQVC